MAMGIHAMDFEIDPDNASFNSAVFELNKISAISDYWLLVIDYVQRVESTVEDKLVTSA